MEETYTFSRALHLMRYGGKKMRCTLWDKVDANDNIMWVDDGDICFTWNGKTMRGAYRFDSDEIMGSWVEVK